MTRSNRRYDKSAPIAAAVACALAAAGVRAADPPAPALQEVTVTGSRVTLSPGMFTPTPVTAVTQTELVKMAPTNIIDSLSELPQFYGNSTYQQALGGQTPSGSELNLRGANTSSGISRTLVLFDGRRTVANSRFGAVDIGSFPDLLVQRVDVVTGGASATYGTDAVAGVVNFVLNTKFEGVQAEAQGGITARNDGPSSKFGLAAGHKFGEKFHVMFALSDFNQDPISDFSSLVSRPWFNQASRVPGPAGGPTWIVKPYVIPTNFSYNGTINGVPGMNGFQFNSTGTGLLPAPTGVLGSVGNACNCLATANETYGVNSMDEVAGGYTRKNAFLRADYYPTDNIDVYAQGLWSKDDANIRWQSAALLGPWAAPVGLDNPFLPPAVASQIQSSLVAAYPNATGPLAAYGPGYRFVYPGRNDLATQYFTYGVFLKNVPGNPLGETRQTTENVTHEGTLGVKANLVSDWQLDAFYTNGSNRENYYDTNGTRVDRLFLAMDAVPSNSTPANPFPAMPGNPICRVSSPAYNPVYYKSFADCVPINLFGGWANISPQAAAYVSGPTKLAIQDYDLVNYELSANGTLFQGWAGPIKAALGASWRKESVFQTTPDPSNEYPAFLNGQLIGNTIATQPTYFRGVIPQGFYINQYGYTQPWPAGAPTVLSASGHQTGGIPGLYYVPTGFLGDANSSTIMFSSERTFGGQTTVPEAFTELNIPLLRDKPFAESLSTDLAARWANYSGPGHVWAWKAGLDWALDDNFRLRATRSRDVRAASLEERFDTTRGGVTVNNPWVLTNGAPTTQSGASYSGGNPNLKPELADTWTAGIVLTPTVLQGFSMSVDYYHIDIADAIDKPTSQDIVNAAHAGDPQYQALVKLDAFNNIVEVDQYFINFAKQFIQGVDFEAAYHRSIRLIGFGPEDISLRLYASDLIKNATLTQFGTYNEMAGQVGPPRSLPKQKVTINFNYTNGPVALFVQGRYISGGILDNTLVESQVAIPGVQTINDNSVGSIFYTDVNLAYTLPVPGTLQLWAQVENVFDRAPPTTAVAFGRAGAVALNPQLYDVIGRRYFLGVRYAF